MKSPLRCRRPRGARVRRGHHPRKRSWQRVQGDMSSSSAPLAAMDTRSVDEIRQGHEWQHEPKWDGFRCILARHADDVAMLSKSGADLKRYYPEIVGAALDLKANRFILDGEFVVPIEGEVSFGDSVQRIHPVASRVKKLAAETPALYPAFEEGKKDVAARPLSERRPLLEVFADSGFAVNTVFRPSLASLAFKDAELWLRYAGGDSDGVVAKRLDLPYQSGNREGLQKIERYRSADRVIGGFRYAEKTQAGRKVAESVLLGLYDADGLLHHVGLSSAIKDKPRLTDKLEKFPAKGASRAKHLAARANGRRKTLVRVDAGEAEIRCRGSYDHFTGGSGMALAEAQG